jgi:hypothetical protein
MLIQSSEVQSEEPSQTAVSYEYSSEHSGSIKVGKFFDKLSDYWLVGSEVPGDRCIMRRFVNCTLHQIKLE